MNYSLHQNDTGSFQELAHASDGIEFAQLSLLTIAPRCERGGHYHTRKIEWFCCTHGKCYMVTTDIRTGQRRSIVLSGTYREFVLVYPYEVHTVLNPHDQECELLIICNEEYDPENPDTIKCESITTGMSDRTVPYDAKSTCDACGKVGAYDFMGDLLCPECAKEATGELEPCNRCGHSPCICGT